MASGPLSLRRVTGPEVGVHTPPPTRARPPSSPSHIPRDKKASGNNPHQAPWIGLLRRFKPPGSPSCVGSNGNNGSSRRATDRQSKVELGNSKSRNTPEPDSLVNGSAAESKSDQASCATGQQEVNNRKSAPSTASPSLRPRKNSSKQAEEEGTLVLYTGFRQSRGQQKNKMWSGQRSESLDQHPVSQDQATHTGVCKCQLMNSCDDANKGILRRNRSQSVPAISSPLELKQNVSGIKAKKGRPTFQKQTSFKEEVCVIYYDEEEQTLAKLSCESEKLKEGSNVQVHITENDAKCDINENCVKDLRGCCKPDMCSLNSLSREPSNNRISSSDKSLNNKMDITSNMQEVTLKHSEDDESMILSGGSTHLQGGITRTTKGIRLMVEISEKCVKNKTCVKALSGGRTLIIMTYRLVPRSDEGEGQIHQYVDKINLPLTIDPYSVRAQVKQTGHLCIEAPVKAF